MKYIESKNNDIFKNIKKLLLKPKNRKNFKRFVVEGLKEITLCLESNYNLIELYVCSEIHNKKYDDLYFKYNFKSCIEAVLRAVLNRFSIFLVTLVAFTF